MNLEEAFQERCNGTSDIHEHLPMLKLFASKCDHVTEFGVREGNSTIALAAGHPKRMVSYDISPMDPDLIVDLKKEIPFHFFQRDTNYLSIEDTDLLFIDTYHSYPQLKNELKLHLRKVRHYLILHDTVAFGTRGEDGNEPGLLAAVHDVMNMKEWVLSCDFKNNNGLMIFERKVKRLAIDERPFIETIIPYEPCRSFGLAVNRMMERAHDWVLILDHDIFLCNPNWYEACLAVTQREGHKAGFITCKSNRTASGIQKCPEAPKSEDLIEHIAFAKSLWREHGTKVTHYPNGIGANGYFMLTHKEAWENSGRYPLRFHVDCDYEREVNKSGYETLVMEGLYVYHLEMKKVDCQCDWADWKDFGKEWQIL